MKFQLSDFAQEWAVALAGKGYLERRDEGSYGENLYVGRIDLSDWTKTAKAAVQSWLVYLTYKKPLSIEPWTPTRS